LGAELAVNLLQDVLRELRLPLNSQLGYPDIFFEAVSFLFELFQFPDTCRAAIGGFALEAGQLNQVGLQTALNLLVCVFSFLAREE
jgi:hypothetical protein